MEEKIESNKFIDVAKAIFMVLFVLGSLGAGFALILKGMFMILGI